jgi:hypothetical protein
MAGSGAALRERGHPRARDLVVAPTGSWKIAGHRAQWVDSESRARKRCPFDLRTGEFNITREVLSIASILTPSRLATSDQESGFFAPNGKDEVRYLPL